MIFYLFTLQSISSMLTNLTENHQKRHIAFASQQRVYRCGSAIAFVKNLETTAILYPGDRPPPWGLEEWLQALASIPECIDHHQKKVELLQQGPGPNYTFRINKLGR